MIRYLGFILLTSVAVPALASLSPAPAAGSAAGTTPRPAARQPLLEQDPRLEKPVTLRRRRSPLSAIVAELARQSDVAMQTSADVADEPALLFVTDQPAKEVMHQLATLFGFRWRRSTKAGVSTYELYQDLRSKQEEAALRNGPHAAALAALQRSLREQMRLAQRPSDLLLREAAALDQKADGRGSFRLRELADPCRRALLQVASRLTPEQWQALVGGEAVHFSTLPEPFAVPLPAALAQALRAARPSVLPPGVPAGFVTAEDEARCVAEEQRSQEAWTRAQGFCVSVELRLMSGEARAEAVLSISPTAVMPAEAPEAPTLLPSVIVVGQGPVAPEAHEPSETPPSWQDDPVLSRKCRLRPLPAAPAEGADRGTRIGDPREPTAPLAECLAAMAESAGINLVADGYRAERSDVSLLSEGEPISLYEALDRYVSPHAGWRREGAFFRVRHHRWYHLRPREIPDRLVRQWAASLRQAPRLTLADAATLALSLRDEQFAQFQTAMGEAGVQIGLGFDEEGPVAARKRAILRAYGSLLPEQQRIVDAGGCVASVAMPPQARRWLRAALTSGWHSTKAGSPHGDLPAEALSLAVVSRSREGRVAEVLFRYQTGSGRVEAFRIVLPRVAAVARS
jgi:hypothetical protein